MRVPQSRVALTKRDQRAAEEQQDRNEKGPKVPVAAVTERMLKVGALTRPGVSQEKQDLV